MLPPLPTVPLSLPWGTHCSDKAGMEHRHRLPGKLGWLWQLHSADPVQQSCLTEDVKVEQPHSRGSHRTVWESRAEGNSTHLMAVIGTRPENTLQMKPFCCTDNLIAVLKELALLTYGKAAFRGKGLKGDHGNSCFSFSLLIPFVPNILMNCLGKEVLKHVLNAALRNKKLSLLGARVTGIPKAGIVLGPLLALECSQHWEWKPAPSWKVPHISPQSTACLPRSLTQKCAQTLIFTICFPNQNIIPVSQRDFRSVRKAMSMKQSPTRP